MAFSVFSYTEQALSALPKRPAESNKRTFGRVLCICGSRGMCGAAYFAAKAAYRMGAGLVRILTVADNLSTLQTLLPEAIVTVYDAEAPEADIIAEAEAWADVLVIGCGLGVTRSSRTLLAMLLRMTKKPMILDADALNLLARNPSLLKYTKGAILTPHPQEMARLCDLPVETVLAASEQIAQDFAERHGAVVVLKRHHTVVSDGTDALYRNQSGNSGMATGGSGDVLAGMLGGLWAQARNGELSALEVACLGVYLHGLCGDAAAQKMGEYSVMASDLIDALPSILRHM